MNREGRQIRYQFLSVLSHELKTPINAVEGYLNIMQGHEAGESIEAYDDMINRSLQRMKGMRKLIMDFLDLTQIESGKKAREIKRVDLAEIARLSIDSMGPLAIQKEVTVQLAGLQPLYYDADHIEFEIVFNNLLSNSIKYNKSGGSVLCELKKGDSGIIIRISDTGIGIPEDDLPKLFNEFVRIKNENTRHIAGSGLGLSIVKRIVDLYKGRIEVESELNKYSTFTLYFPEN